MWIKEESDVTVWEERPWGLSCESGYWVPLSELRGMLSASGDGKPL